MYELCCIFHTVQCNTLFCIVLYFTVLYRTVQHCTVQNCTALYFNLLLLYFICFQTQHLTIVLFFSIFSDFISFCKFILAKMKLQYIFWEKINIFKCIFWKLRKLFTKPWWWTLFMVFISLCIFSFVENCCKDI